MSAPFGFVSPRHSLGDPRRLGLAIVVPLLLAIVAAGITSAGRPPNVVSVSPADALRSGSLISLHPRKVGSASLLEVQAPEAQLLLAVAADGSQAAMADQLGQASGTLSLAHADGSQLRVALPGLLAAGFAADGSWLAVVDGRGSLWRVDATSGEAATIADGPFLGAPIATADGSLLLLAVSSVEAPFHAQVVRVSPSSGAVTPLTEDQLDYAAYPLADGGVAVVSHQPDGTAVRRVAAGASELMTMLESSAINVAVSPDGRRIAYEREGGGIVLVDALGTTPRLLGAGSHPCFAPDASSLLVRRGTWGVALALDGSVLASTQRPSGFAAAAGCLP